MLRPTSLSKRKNHDQLQSPIEGHSIIKSFSYSSVRLWNFSAKSFLTLADKLARTPDKSSENVKVAEKTRETIKREGSEFRFYFRSCLGRAPAIINVNWWTAERAALKSHEYEKINIEKANNESFSGLLNSRKFTYYWKKYRKFQVEISIVFSSLRVFEDFIQVGVSLSRNSCRNCVILTSALHMQIRAYGRGW